MTQPLLSVIRASAPTRLDFAGAWTDVAPFAMEARGAVVNAAIDLRTRVELYPARARYQLWAKDLGQCVEASHVAELGSDGTLDLLKAAIRRSAIGPCALHTSAEAPPGSGLGTSGALGVALIHAIGIAQGERRTARDIAHEAWQLETVDAAVAGGQQDQYAAAVGGFQHLVFDHGTTSTRSLQIEPQFASYLADHLVLCYTGRSRFSGDTITRVMQAYSDRDTDVVDALYAMVDLADAMAEALGAEDAGRIGELLSANWRQQQRLDPAMCTPEMARLETAMAAAGAAGGKAAGAGAGGCMFFIVPGNVRSAYTAARACGATVLPVRWAKDGVTAD